MSEHSAHSHGTMSQLMIGFGLAALLSIIPFYLVMADTGLSSTAVVAVIMILAAIQIIVHLVFFLHVNREVEGGWTFAATIFAVIVLVIVLAGSIWVMYNMNKNMMPMPSEEEMLEMMSLQNQQG